MPTSMAEWVAPWLTLVRNIKIAFLWRHYRFLAGFGCILMQF